MMKSRLKPLLPTLLLGGIWGEVTYIISSVLLLEIPLVSFLFFPILFTGIVFIITFALGSKIKYSRTLIVGLASGFVYQVLSPALPLLSSVLVGASLGGGLSHNEGTFKDLLKRFFSILKGIILFPIFIFAGGVLTSLTTSITGSLLILWFSWGSLLSLAIWFIYSPLLSSGNSENDFQTHSDVDEFKSGAQQILEELNRLASRTN